MQWGQFISHDLGKTSQPFNGKCPQCQANPDVCANIPVQPFDPSNFVFQVSWVHLMQFTSSYLIVSQRPGLRENGSQLSSLRNESPTAAE